FVDEVMGLGPRRFTGGMPFGASVGEISNDFLLFGVNRDHRLIHLGEEANLFVQVVELAVSIGMGGALLLLGRSLERVAEFLLQDTPDGRSEERRVGKE